MEFERLAQLKTQNDKVLIIVDEKTPLGEIHDALMRVKGDVVMKMNEHQKKEEEAVKQVKENKEKAEAEKEEAKA